ncbi:hypothetical protein VP01_1844g2 [Puccinia sorghi]|uniref:D-lactate dehydrogenase (cytochrome) n=1 Tax=Puccinia sorghi TaxID=27349 RepID=A0A0L6VE97_9BASI|nr:hypothetical protein VP01_1844g2 [Puccinia sorghi]
MSTMSILKDSKNWRVFRQVSPWRLPSTTRRLLYQHASSIGSGKQSIQPRQRMMTHQKWSTTMVFLTSTMIGSIMYVVGINVQLKKPLDPSKETLPQPSPKQFSAALEQIKKILPVESISRHPQDLLYHGTSAWSYHHPDCLPGAVLYPCSTQDVSNIVKVASQYRIPIVPFSGGTSLEGHFNAPSSKPITRDNQPSTDENQLAPGYSFCIDFSRNMNKIIAVHGPSTLCGISPCLNFIWLIPSTSLESDLDVVVQPGVSYEDLNYHLKRSASPHKLFFPVDPGPGAQIGGMIGTGCSGTNAVKYGTMRENVINMTVVLANGEVIKTRQRAKWIFLTSNPGEYEKNRKCAAGPDLGKLFIGSEGTLGLVTEVTLKLQPVLPTSVGVTHFENVDAATGTVLQLIQEGVSLACIELLDDQMMKAIKHSSSTGVIYDEKPSLFLKFTGTLAQIKSDEELTGESRLLCQQGVLPTKILKRNGGSPMRIAKSEAEAEEIWHARKVCLWSTLDYMPGHRIWTTDVCVPISHLPRLISETKADIQARNLKATMLGHVGDGNFHCIILFKDHLELAQVRQCVDQMVQLAQHLDGTCTGEHVVVDLKTVHPNNQKIVLGRWSVHLENELGKGTLDLLRTIKKTLDPLNIFNPGKLIPPPSPSPRTS